MYITLTKKKLFVLLCAVLTAFLLLIQFMSVTAESIDVSTNAKRVEYINTLSVELKSDNYISKEIVVPKEFDDVYNKYNALQREANFDLREYKGKKVTVYTYECKSETVVNLMVYKGKLIGGDIAETRLSGRMLPLKGR